MISLALLAGGGSWGSLPVRHAQNLRDYCVLMKALADLKACADTVTPALLGVFQVHGMLHATSRKFCISCDGVAAVGLQLIAAVTLLLSQQAVRVFFIARLFHCKFIALRHVCIMLSQ